MTNELGPTDAHFERLSLRTNQRAGQSNKGNRGEVMQVLGTNGILVFTGVPGRQGPIQLDNDRLMRNLVLRNQVAFGTVNADREAFEAAIRDFGTFRRRWPEAVRALIPGDSSSPSIFSW